MLTFRDIDLGIQEGRLNLDLLYPDKSSRGQFERKWGEFFASDPTHPEIFRREEDGILVFRTESLIPLKSSTRPSVLLLLGNPASHSVHSGMFFSYEGKNREHRFWVALRETGFLKFHSDASLSHLPWQERSQNRKQEFYNLEYDSPFRIGLAVYFSLPSTASGPPWSGVSGIRRLFGKKALSAIAVEEQRRVGSIIRDFVASGGAVIAFQRDAYEGVRAPNAPTYSFGLARRGELHGRCRHKPDVYLLGVPPTRIMLSNQVRHILVQFRGQLLKGLSR